MSRRRKAVKRPVMPDPKFKDIIISKFTSCIMFDGKKSTAEEAFRNTRKGAIQNFRDRAGEVLKSIIGVGGATLKNLGDAIDDKGFRRVT